MSLSFRDLHLSDMAVAAIEAVGYTTPTDVQARVIPHVLIGRDVVALAQTGTGKTAAYALPLIDILSHGRSKVRMPRALILVPTRELAHQVFQDFTTYSAHAKLEAVVLVGGESMVDQQRMLSRGVDVIIATPGRLMDIIARGLILLTDTKILILDEADRMLDMGFLPDIESIMVSLPPQRQTLLLSATMPVAIEGLVKKFLNAPKEIKLVSNTSARTLVQKFHAVTEESKAMALHEFLAEKPTAKGFVFCNRKRDAAALAKTLQKAGIKSMALHGDLPQSERTKVIEAFRSAGEGGVFLVATDIAARGLDIDDIDFVINADIPLHAEDYIHRIGRAGRAGRSGESHSFVTPKDLKLLEAVAKLTQEEAVRVFLETFSVERFQKVSKAPQNPTERSSARTTGQTSGRTKNPRHDRDARMGAEESLRDASTPAPKQPEHPRSEVSAARARTTQPSRRDNHPRSRATEDKPVVGFGDETPNFFRHSLTIN